MSPSATVAGGGRRRLVTRDLVIEKILRWNELYGEPPRTSDWNPSLARWRAQEWRIERYRRGDPATGEPWPSINAAKSRFGGSFDAAVRAAGLEPHRPGPRAPSHDGAAPGNGAAPTSSGRPVANGNGNGNGNGSGNATRTGGGPVGPGPLADAVRAVARARATNDHLALDAALARVASAAARWRERL